jgi:hypothetical protein
MSVLILRPTGITDQDLTNNYSTVSTTVLNPSLDLRIEKGVDNHGIGLKLTGNVFTIQVTNMSAKGIRAQMLTPVHPLTVTETRFRQA